MNVQVIMKDGRPEWAVLPYAEYEALLARAAAVEQAAQPVTAPAPADGTAESGLSQEDRRQLRQTMIAQLQDVAAVAASGSFQGSKMAEIMSRKGLAVELVAREVGISPLYLKQIEQGERQPSEPILRNIARALNVAVTELSAD